MTAALVLRVTGLALNLAGTYIAGSALWQDWRDFGRGQPLVPFIPRLRSWVRTALLRRPPTGRPPRVMDEDKVPIRDSADSYRTAPKSAPLEEKVKVLREQMEQVLSRFGIERAETNTELAKVRGDIDKARSAATTGVARVEGQVRDIAIGTARRELFGLVLVGFGQCSPRSPPSSSPAADPATAPRGRPVRGTTCTATT